jgi:TetR/AcrR family transcriptional repressor of nem operon
LAKKTELSSAAPSAREKLLDAALQLVREKGYAATSVDDLCREAGVTKGAFFHHFKSKDVLAVAAVQRWSELAEQLFANAPYHGHSDPLQRFLAYLDFRKEILQGEVAEFTCFAGTMVQEAYNSHPAVREACRACITGHANALVADIDSAMRARGLYGQWSAESLALHSQAVIQGAFILAKSQPNEKEAAKIAVESIDHLKRYVQFLFRETGALPACARTKRS